MREKIKEFVEGYKKGQKNFGDNISTIINSILLTLVYILGIGLTSIFAKIFKKHFLSLKIDKNKMTYWEDLNLSNKTMGDCYKQF